MTERVRIRNGSLSAAIAARGAELSSLIPAGGKDVMWSGDPAIWPWSAPNLFPIVGALADDVLVHDGKPYPMKQHGFLRHSLCEVVSMEGDACAFRLTDSAETLSQYPFAFALTISYRLDGDRLCCVFALRNPADKPLYASLGAHPAFRWPLGDAPRSDYLALFEQPEPAPIRRLIDRRLSPEPWPTPVEGRALNLTGGLFDHDAVIFDRLVSRAVTFGAPGGPAVEISFPDFPDFGVWSKPGTAPFLCLEPWQGYASPAGFSGEFAQKPGVVAVAPGATRSWRYAIRPLPLMPSSGDGYPGASDGWMR